MGRFLGIDVGSQVVSAAVLEVGYRKLAVVATREVAVDSMPSLEEAVRACAMPLLEHLDGMAAAIDGDVTFTHRITLPATAIKQMDEVLQFELEAAVPVDLDELVWGYRLLPRSGAKAPVTVLVSAARVEHVRKRIELVKTALGREPDRIAHGSLTLANLAVVAPDLRGPGPFGLVDLGGRRTEITVIASGEPVFTRTLSRGVGTLPEGAPALAAEIRQTLAAYNALDGDDLQAVFLLGGGAAAEGAEAYFAYELGVPVRPFPSFGGVGAGAEPPAQVGRFAKAIALAVAAAGRGHDIDLRRGQLAFQRGFGVVKERAPLLVGLGGAVLVSFLFAVWAELRALSKELDVAAADLAQATTDAFGEGTSDPAEAQEMLTQAKNQAESDPMPRMDAFDVMVAISNAIPASVTHDIEELDMQRGHVRIQGVVGSTADASLVKDEISKHRCTNDAKIGKITQMVNSTRQKYVLEFDVKCPEDAGAKKKTAANDPESAGKKPSSEEGVLP
ncbi:MAG TPA: pilus assembly protein PilM [Polyangiaceae bacterium]